jgi:hypothetical protein
MLDNYFSSPYTHFVKKDRLILAQDRLNTQLPTNCSAK